MEISNFEQGLITAIENIKDNPTKGNVKALKSFFNKGFNSNQATLFEIFSGDRLTYEQQKILFDSIEVRQKCILQNESVISYQIVEMPPRKTQAI